MGRYTVDIGGTPNDYRVERVIARDEETDDETEALPDGGDGK